MWISILGFAIATLLLLWLVCGYFVWLRFLGDTRRQIDVEHLTRFPALSIVVPCYNEERFVAEKLENLLACQYRPNRREIVFADGGSTDATLEILEHLAADSDGVRVVRCPRRGKINQLNHVLPTLRGDVVVITDADARLAGDALKWLAAEFESDPDIGVVGACTSPRGGLPVERCYWTAQNRVRLLESKVAHVSIVTACCYAFRRRIITEFPPDVVADDVYAALAANTAGLRSTYSTRATVEELRSPATLPEFFRHKFRKGNAVLREMLRVCHRLPDMNSRWKAIFATSLAQQLLLPWVAGAWVALAATLANLGQLDVVGLGTILMLIGLLAARKSVVSLELPHGVERFGPVTVGLAFCYTLGIVFVAALTYTFYRQDSCYARLPDAATPQSPRRQRPKAENAPVISSVVSA